MRALFCLSLGAAALTLPFTAYAADPVADARRALATDLPSGAARSLVHTRTLSLRGGSAVRFSQTHAGLPIISRGATALLDERGRARRVRSRLAPIPTLGATPTLSAFSATRVSPWPFDPANARLAWLPSKLGTRLVWTFYEGQRPGRVFAPAAVVDAHTGALLLAFDAARRDREATLYVPNPVKAPAPETVMLDALDPGATTLANARIEVANCIDRGTVESARSFDMHVCDIEPTALADASGDFPYLYQSDYDPEDAHAEVAMFFHVSRAYAYFESIGMPALEEPPLACVVNFRMAEGLWSGGGDPQTIADPNIPLEPLDNAFFSPASPFFERFWNVGRQGLWFGQGRQRDFGYDGDVIAHEFGHAAIERTAQLVPWWILDEQGSTPAAGAMNEALADYFSAAIGGDPFVGEYVGQGFGGLAIRELANDHRCPTHLAGEVHADSTLFSGALWNARLAIAEADRLEFDRALMTALDTSPTGELDYSDLAEQFVDSLAMSPLGSAAADVLTAAFEARGVLPRCERVRDWEGVRMKSHLVEYGGAFFSPGFASMDIPSNVAFAPGHFQLRVPLDEPDAESVRLSWNEAPIPGSGGLSFGGELTPADLAALVKFGDDPIRFEYGPGVQHDAVLVETDSPGQSAVTVPIPAGATTAYFMLVNRGEADGGFTDLDVRFVKPPPGTGGTSGAGGASGGGGFGTGGFGAEPAAGAAGAPPALDGDAPDVHPAGGCGCRAAAIARTPDDAALSAFAVLFWFNARRRRARAR